ncbi:aminopeptidase P family protein [Amycolatopsis acidicola]|uniref:Aminopeptidase P family protein n=1 Tax=Amycolatopsis acidicola TaxID=2596893 RepID=A0A5N0V239_9PSEU|nr:Xaa-Pro peptidase family protein [Amycolatopsis acidicola]KAA9160085.1 aminopeptidase P family protein [Amycolatopsis acidicola]
MPHEGSGAIVRSASTFGPMQVDWEPRVDMDRLRTERLAKTREAMAAADLDYLIQLRAENARYSTGIKRLYWPTIQLGGGPLVVLAAEGDSAVWIIDPDYAAQNIPWIPDERFHTPYQMDIDRDVESFVDDLLHYFGSGVETARIGVDIWSPAMYDVLHRRLPNATFVNGQEAMIGTRRIKTRDEITCLKLAYSISEAGMQAAVDILRPGVRECELVGECFRAMWALGTETTQCSEVVNSGPGAHPYRRFHSDRIVQHGDLVNMDFGGCFSGYFGDFCRAFVCGGKPTSAQVDLLKKAHELQLEQLGALGPGVTPKELCAKLGRRTLGHGIGISAFEGPHLRAVDDYPLEPGMAFSVTSPPLGEDGVGGVHLEDEIIITETGIDLYSTYPYTLG